MSKAIRRRTIGDEEILFIEDLEGLMALVQSELPGDPPVGLDAGCVEKPDRITMDLDPAEDVPWTALIEGALRCGSD